MSKLDRSWSGNSILIDDIEVTDADIKDSSKTALYVVRRNAERIMIDVQKSYYLSDREWDNIKDCSIFEHTCIIILNTCCD